MLSEQAASLQVPAADGSLGILAGHAPLLAELGVGECRVRLVDGSEEQFALAGGFLEVSRERVTVLADTAERATEIDVTRVEEEIARARELLTHLDGTGDADSANETLRRAQNRLRIARGGS